MKLSPVSFLVLFLCLNCHYECSADLANKIKASQAIHLSDMFCVIIMTSEAGITHHVTFICFSLVKERLHEQFI